MEARHPDAFAMDQQAAPKSSNPWLFIAGVAVVLLLIGLSYPVVPAPPKPAPRADAAKAADEDVVFVLDTQPPAPAARDNQAAAKPR
jgi:hypothetical protein